MKITIPASALRNPRDSQQLIMRIEPDLKCHGEICGRAVFSPTGELEDIPGHYHLVESGKNPEAGPRYHAVGDGLPELVYESDH